MFNGLETKLGEPRVWDPYTLTPTVFLRWYHVGLRILKWKFERPFLKQLTFLTITHTKHWHRRPAHSYPSNPNIFEIKFYFSPLFRLISNCVVEVELVHYWCFHAYSYCRENIVQKVSSVFKRLVSVVEQICSVGKPTCTFFLFSVPATSLPGSSTLPGSTTACRTQCAYDLMVWFEICELEPQGE